MNFLSLIEPIQRVSYSIDDSSLALMSLLVGMIGGWKITNWRDQLKARRVRVQSKAERSDSQDR